MSELEEFLDDDIQGMLDYEQYKIHVLEEGKR